jgi:phosphotransferase system  glucose/maltose/N-acetylglucosamine-specific IIC component
MSESIFVGIFWGIVSFCIIYFPIKFIVIDRMNNQTKLKEKQEVID